MITNIEWRLVTPKNFDKPMAMQGLITYAGTQWLQLWAQEENGRWFPVPIKPLDKQNQS
jgi:hypothetical protein